VELLQTRAEGWPAGLRLLAASLGRLPAGADRRASIEHLAHTDRLVFDFLAEEVLNQQEPELKAFLLQTAILAELTPALCQAVTGRADAAVLLDELYRRNLFLVAVDEAGKQKRASLPGASAPLHPRTYRYHDLFAEFLRHRLQQEMPERISDLHRRAAQAESDPTRAVAHYLAAARWSEAAALIEQVGAEISARGYLDTPSRWINALPIPVQESRPRLNQYLAVCAWQKDRLTEAQSLLEQARQGFKAAGDARGQGEMLANLAHLALHQAEWERSAALADRALTHPAPPHIQAQLLMGRAVQKLNSGDWTGGERDFKTAVDLIQTSEELDLLSLLTTNLEPAFAFLPGSLEGILRQKGVQPSPG